MRGQKGERSGYRYPFKEFERLRGKRIGILLWLLNIKEVQERSRL